MRLGVHGASLALTVPLLGLTPATAWADGWKGQTAGEAKPGETPATAFPRHFVSLAAQLDVLMLDAAEDVCGSVDGIGGALTTYENFACFRPDGGGEFLGKPLALAGESNSISGGPGFADTRLLLGYDVHVGAGFTAGLRLGYAFGGSPSVGDALQRYLDCESSFTDCREPTASDFMPFHVELQVRWFPLEKLAPPKALTTPRPYVFTGFGVGQVNAGVPVAVCDTVAENGGPIVSGDDVCDSWAVLRSGIEAYQTTGLNFLPLGAGVLIPLHENFAIDASLKAMVMMPTSGFVLAPVIAPVAMF